MSKLQEHLMLREGFREEVYLDTLGKPTVGVGHLLTADELQKYKVGDKVPKNILDEMFEKDVATAVEAAKKQMTILGIESEDFEIALVSVNFQLGTRWYTKFPTAWKCLCHKKYGQAMDEVMFANIDTLKYSRWFKQTPVRVLDFLEAIFKIMKEA